MNQALEGKLLKTRGPVFPQLRPLAMRPFPIVSSAMQIITELHEAEASDIARSGRHMLPIRLVNAVERRQAEYLVARACAAHLLSALGARSTEVGFGNNREPLWPAGFVGSITHAGPWVAAAVAPANRLASIGIDTETVVDASGADQIAATCLRDEELQMLKIDNRFSRMELVTLIFSAKEAFFKALYPVVNQYFDFLDAGIDHIDMTEGAIRVTLKRPLAGFQNGFSVTGTFRFEGGHVFTVCELGLASAALGQRRVGAGLAGDWRP
jgi:enterobactin synthetase component D